MKIKPDSSIIAKDILEILWGLSPFSALVFQGLELPSQGCKHAFMGKGLHKNKPTA